MKKFLKVVYKILFIFSDYRPKKVTFYKVWDWIRQFPINIRLQLFFLLDDILFITEKETRSILTTLNNQLLEKLREDGIDIHNVIYICHDTGLGSSHVMLSILRDSANLERRGATLISDSGLLQKETNRIGKGAIVYVDDFLGTGSQFIGHREWFSNFITGAFSEFVLAPVICEESYTKLDAIGVQPLAKYIHRIIDRPLIDSNNYLRPKVKEQIIGLCNNITPKFGLGYQNSAAMVVIYRNSVTNIPSIFRGSLKQSPYKGIFPRADDLPFN